VSVEEEPLWLEASATPFHRALGESLRKFGLKQCKTDPSIFMSEDMIVGCYVDDVLVRGDETLPGDESAAR
jgi:hypothetical protein